MNRGPRLNLCHSFSICHWNLNSLTAHNYLNVSLLRTKGGFSPQTPTSPPPLPPLTPSPPSPLPPHPPPPPPVFFAITSFFAITCKQVMSISLASWKYPGVSALKDISIAKKRSQSLKFWFSFLKYELTELCQNK